MGDEIETYARVRVARAGWTWPGMVSSRACMLAGSLPSLPAIISRARVGGERLSQVSHGHAGRRNRRARWRDRAGSERAKASPDDSEPSRPCGGNPILERMAARITNAVCKICSAGAGKCRARFARSCVRSNETRRTGVLAGFWPQKGKSESCGFDTLRPA